MIRSLRKKIIAINVISVCIVFLIAEILMFAISFTRLDSERNARILSAFEFDYDNENFDETKIFNDIALVVYDNESGNVDKCFIGNKADIGEEFLYDKLNSVVASSKDSGIISWRVKYNKLDDGKLTKIVFYNRLSRNSNLKSYLLGVGVTVLLGIACYLVLSIVLAKIALKPVEESWNKQKQFVADASHELKTPLSVIMANTEIIASHRDETVESQMRWIDNTRSESQRMADLVADLLFLAKNDDGLKVQMEKTNVSDCIETTVLSYDAVFYENGKIFCYDIAPDLYVSGNEGQLKQLATILLDNANKYSVGNGNISLSLTCAGRHLNLSVSNDSDELTAEQLTHLFDRFYTVDKSRNSDKGGNGLGLSIAQIICRTHGGDISADYADGRVTITAELPLYRAKKESNGNRQSS
ncbi:MAG: HAMP domain-containing histidine kinase [Corallococcus sp.]|nr:HAMP domain-containing histidine kinase [Bacillota bacterium]MCM1533182.1 HAMP domain-containing histidine kinase [Corallococcus sp.]